jgi:hypothetical protein
MSPMFRALLLCLLLLDGLDGAFRSSHSHRVWPQLKPTGAGRVKDRHMPRLKPDSLHQTEGSMRKIQELEARS